MFCGKCGSANQNGNFCAVCGFQNRGNTNSPILDKSVQSRPVIEKGEAPRNPFRISFWEIIGVVFGATWIFTGINILSNPDCNSVSLLGGSRYTISLACSSAGTGGQGWGFLMVIIGLAIILFSFRRILFSKK